MRLFPQLGSRGRRHSARRKRRDWLALWLQDRRRRRGADVDEPVTLFTDLVGYWDGDSPAANVGAVADFVFSGAVAWGYDVGPGSGPSVFMDNLYDSAAMENWDAQFQDITAGPTTWNLWVKVHEDGGLADIMGLFVVGDGGYFPTLGLSYGDHGLVWLNADGSGHQTWPFVAMPGPPLFGEWIMVTVVLEAGRFRLYINGALSIDQAFSGFYSLPAEPFRINGRFWMWTGEWANFGFWTRALEAGEVSALYNDGTGLTAGELT